MTECPNQAANKDFCNCTYSCSRKGKCCECVQYHQRRGELPACFFPADAEKTYNRSIDYFVQLHS
ncbi:MAG: DUF6485 family protein [Halanaerobiaceae bacterium]